MALISPVIARATNARAQALERLDVYWQEAS